MGVSANSAASGLCDSRPSPRYNRSLGWSLAGLFMLATLGAVESLAERRRRVEQMPPQQREELFRNEKKFRGLPLEDQQRIRDLHEQIESAPDRDKLRTTLNRYCKWLDAQTPFRRAKLSDKRLSLKDRIQSIKETIAKQDPNKDFHLDDKSRRALVAWLDHYLAEHRTHFLEGIAQSHPEISKLPPERQERLLREMLLRRRQAGGHNVEMFSITEPEKARLRDALSPELRSKLERERVGEQTQFIAGLLREATTHDLDDELASFFESIPGDEQEKLMSLPDGKVMYNTLREQYAEQLEKSKPGELPRGPRPRGRRPGPPSGPADRPWPDGFDGKVSRISSASKGNPGSSGEAFQAQERQVEKTSPENPRSKGTAMNPPAEKALGH
jgi:hypothetical protein